MIARYPANVIREQNDDDDDDDRSCRLSERHSLNALAKHLSLAAAAAAVLPH